MSSAAIAFSRAGSAGVQVVVAPRRQRARSLAPTPIVEIGLAPARAKAAVPEFRAIFEGECGYVWSTLLRLGVRPADVEDVAHEVFLTVHRRLGDYDTSRPIRPWIFGISLRASLRYRNLAKNRREVMPGDYDITDERPTAEDELAGAQARALLARGLVELSVDRRAVLVMHDIDGLAMPEIARALALPLNTAYSRLRLARADLKAAVTRLRG